MLEEYVPVLVRGITLGVARGLYGFAKNKKEDEKEKFDTLKYLKSVGICAGLGIVAELLLPFLPIEKDVIVGTIVDYVAPWVGTSVVEAIFLK